MQSAEQQQKNQTWEPSKPQIFAQKKKEAKTKNLLLKALGVSDRPGACQTTGMFIV